MKDADFVEVQAQITLVEPRPLRISATPYRYLSGYNISCYECYNGSIDVTVDDGVPPYSYDWGDEVYTQDRSALGALPYAVSVTDANQCRVGSERITLTQPERSDWQMGGNANTDPSTQYIGTSDAQDVVLKSNGMESFRLLPDGGMKMASLAGTEPGLLKIGTNGIVTHFPLADRVGPEIAPVWYTSGNYLDNDQTTEAFMGSIDPRPVEFRTNNLPRMRLLPEGATHVLDRLYVGDYPSITAANPARMSIRENAGGWLTMDAQWGGEWRLRKDGGPAGSALDLSFDYLAGGTAMPGQSRLIMHAHGGFSSTGFVVHPDGKVTIGDVTMPSPYRLYVKDGILTERVKVAGSATLQWADYVFDRSYHLRDLKEVEAFISLNRHLPGVPTLDGIRQTGNDLHATDVLLLEKIEELVLYSIGLSKTVEDLQCEVDLLRSRITDMNSNER